VSAERAYLSRGNSMQSAGLLVKPQIDSNNPVNAERERKAFGQRVLRARLEFGARQKPPRSITQTELGEAMGVTGVAVGSWEAGRKQPDVGTIHKLAFTLGVRAAWLAWGEEPMRAEAHDPPPRRRADSR
jgi:DNA-binding XRE family transcriptional regulator